MAQQLTITGSTSNIQLTVDQAAQGLTGATGATGIAGINGATGSTGPIGATGLTGSTGPQGDPGGATGATGPQGDPGGSSSVFGYKAKTNTQTGDPGSGFIIWNNSTQINATSISMSHFTDLDRNIALILHQLKIGDTIVIQDFNDYLVNQTWQVSNNIIEQTGYDEIPVTLISGTAQFSLNQNLTSVITIAGVQGSTGATGSTGPQGDVGATGLTGATGLGATGATGVQGDIGATGLTGSTGATGPQGDVGATGSTGPQGDVGATGSTGPQGDVGATGSTGPQGDVGATGATGSFDGTLTQNLNANGYNISNANNVTTSNVSISNVATLANNYTIKTEGYYITFNVQPPLPIGLPNNDIILTFEINGDITANSNVINNVLIVETLTYQQPLNLTDYQDFLVGLSVYTTSGVNDSTPLLNSITSVDGPNNTITLSTNFLTTKNQYFQTGAMMYDVSTNTYISLNTITIGRAISTDSGTNTITVDNINPFDEAYTIASFGSTKQGIKFLGTSFGNIVKNQQYYIENIDYGNSTIQLSDSPGGNIINLTTDSGSMVAFIYDNNPNALQDEGFIISGKDPSSSTWFGGPWPVLPTYSDLNTVTDPNFSSTPTFDFGYVRPIRFNSDNPSYLSPGGGIVASQYAVNYGSLVVGTLSAPTLDGIPANDYGVNGITIANDGTDPNIAPVQTGVNIVSYTDGARDLAAISGINAMLTGGLTMYTYTGNTTTPLEDQYLRTGRSIGKIGFYGSQKLSDGSYYINPGYAAYAGIYAQALGDWDATGPTGTTLPMVFALQYSPLNGQNGSYTAINRTFLQAANNTTSIGGASTIEFKPLPRTNSIGQNRSISALGNVTLNPQTFANISGYVAGTASANGQGSLFNVTTTASTWNGDVALRLSRTVGNTANMEFKLPVGNSNQMLLVDNNSGNTIASFADGNVVITNLAVSGIANLNNLDVTGFFTTDSGADFGNGNLFILQNGNIDGGSYYTNGGDVDAVNIISRGFMKYPVYTASALTAITGQVGWMAAVSDSAGAGNPNGMIAFWDTTNSRWSYVHDNSAV